MTSKVCTTCFEQRPIESFKTSKRGIVASKCNVCVNEYHRIYNANYRVANREQINANKRASRIIDSVKNLRQNTKKKPKCKVRGCDEPPLEYNGLHDYCRSHAWDKHVLQIKLY